MAQKDARVHWYGIFKQETDRALQWISTYHHQECNNISSTAHNNLQRDRYFQHLWTSHSSYYKSTSCPAQNKTKDIWELKWRWIAQCCNTNPHEERTKTPLNKAQPLTIQEQNNHHTHHGIKLDIRHWRASFIHFMRHQFVSRIFVPVGNHAITATAGEGVEVVEVQRVHTENITAVSIIRGEKKGVSTHVKESWHTTLSRRILKKW